MSITLDKAVAALEAIAPPAYAASWDNVGLLLRPSRPRKVQRVLLAIDLTAAVLEEAIAARAELIVAYHPLIFDPLGRLDSRDAKQAVVVRAIEKRIAVYSPHTALDAAGGGINDWLVEGLGEVKEARPIEPHIAADPGADYKLVVTVPTEDADALRDGLAAAGAGQIGNYSRCSFNVAGEGTFFGSDQANPRKGERGRLERVDELRMEMVCPALKLAAVRAALYEAHPYEEPAWELYPLAGKPVPGVGQGRVAALERPVKFDTIVLRMKSHLGLENVRIAPAPAHEAGEPVERIAVCPGAGGSLFRGCAGEAEVYITGEMRHHDVLALNAAGASVILTDHTNTERPYLPRLAERLTGELGAAVKIAVSERDRDPLRIV